VTVRNGDINLGTQSKTVKVFSLKDLLPANFTEGNFIVKPGDNTPVTYKIPAVYFPQYSGDKQYLNEYQWVIPNGWKYNNKVSDGTPFTTDDPSITVTPNDCNGGTIKVRGVSGCSDMSKSDYREKEINRAGNSISSSTSTIVCGDPKEITLKIGSVPNASYQWIKPSSWTWTSSTNTNIVKVMPDGLLGGEISVIVDGCTSLKESKTIMLKDWAVSESTPSISGAKVICTSGSNYSLLNAYSNVTSITWSASPASLFTNSTGSGSNAFLKAFFFKVRGVAEIKFSLYNQCGEIYEVKYNVWVGPPSGSEIVCISKLVGLNSIIEADALSSGATYYNWSIDGGIIKYAQGTSNVVVETGSTCLTNLCLRVRGENACGAGIYAYKYIPMDCSGLPSGSYSFNSDPLIASKIGLSEEDNSKQLADTQVNFEYENVINSVAIYPNPVEDIVNVQIPGNLIVDNNCSIEIYNSTGKLLLKKKVTSTINSIDLSNSPSGIYIVKLLTNQEIITKKIIKK